MIILSFFYLFIILLYYDLKPLLAEEEINNCNTQKIKNSGTGTVLFTPIDAIKSCWSQEEIALLTARIILEDVVPDAKLIILQCNSDVEDLVEYFKLLINTVRARTKSRKRHIMLMALCDLLGGYLHHAIFPMAKKSFYAGAIDYQFMEKLIQLYEELKWFLRTNGQGWTTPLIIAKDIPVQTISMDSLNSAVHCGNDSCCHKLMFYEHEPAAIKSKENLEKGTFFPLPFFDAKVRPSAIVVPFKHFALRNIESKRASYVIMKYFIAAEQCLRENKAKPESVHKFQNELFTWILKDVQPKLIDDKFYSAFGGIIRVKNTLQSLGARAGNHPCPVDEVEDEVGAVPGVACSSRRNKLLLIAMLVIIVAWFFIGTCFICYRMKNNRISTKDYSNSNNNNNNNNNDEAGKSSSTFSSSRWNSLMSSSSKSSRTSCKCEESSTTMNNRSEKSTVESSSSGYNEAAKKRYTKYVKKNRIPSCQCPPPPPRPPSAFIDTKNSVKMLPSIEEMSENSTNKHDKKSLNFLKRISYDSSTKKICAPPWSQSDNTIPCPSNKFSNKNSSKTVFIDDDSTLPLANSTMMKKSTTNSPEISTSVTQSSTVTDGTAAEKNDISSTINKSEQAEESTMRIEDVVQAKKSESIEITESKHNTTPEDDDDDGNQEEEEEEMQKQENNDQHVYFDFNAPACHSTISGTYDLYRKSAPHKPYIFGYDFQTTTSSDLSDDEE